MCELTACQASSNFAGTFAEQVVEMHTVRNMNGLLCCLQADEVDFVKASILRMLYCYRLCGHVLCAEHRAGLSRQAVSGQLHERTKTG